MQRYLQVKFLFCEGGIVLGMEDTEGPCEGGTVLGKEGVGVPLFLFGKVLEFTLFGGAGGGCFAGRLSSGATPCLAYLVV